MINNIICLYLDGRRKSLRVKKKPHVLAGKLIYFNISIYFRVFNDTLNYFWELDKSDTLLMYNAGNCYHLFNSA